MAGDPAGGPADGKAAVPVKLHHAIADGQGAVMLGQRCSTSPPEGAGSRAHAPEPTAEELDQSGFADVMRGTTWVGLPIPPECGSRSRSGGAGADARPGAMANQGAATTGSILRLTKAPAGAAVPG